MKRWVNGCVEQMQEQEAQAMLQAQLSQHIQLSPEQRLDKLEQALEGIRATLERVTALFG